jgi:hypothetical protein
MYTAAIIATENQQLTMIAALESKCSTSFSNQCYFDKKLAYSNPNALLVRLERAR